MNETKLMEWMFCVCTQENQTGGLVVKLSAKISERLFLPLACCFLPRANPFIPNGSFYFSLPYSIFGSGFTSVEGHVYMRRGCRKAVGWLGGGLWRMMLHHSVMITRVGWEKHIEFSSVHLYIYVFVCHRFDSH